MRSLPLFHRIAGKKVIVLGEGAMAEPKRRLVERAGGIVVGEDDSEALLAFVALDEPDGAAARLKARGVLVNVVDRPELCDFTVPSLLDRDPVLVAVGTSGATAGLAKQLRLRLEGMIPQSVGALASALESARAAIRERFPDAVARRRALDQALSEGGAVDPFAGHGEQELERWLSDVAGPQTTGVFEIVLSSADPDDLTLRQARLLGAAGVLLVGAGVPDAILNRARADAVRLPLAYQGELPSGPAIKLRFA